MQDRGNGTRSFESIERGAMARTEKQKKYSYIKKPFAKNGWYSLPLAFLAMLMTAFTFTRAVHSGGTLPIAYAALGLTGAVFAAFGLWFAALGLMEAGKNHVISIVCAVLSGLTVLYWILVVAAGALLS